MDFLGQDRREGLGRKVHSRFVLLLLILVSVFLLLSSLYSAQASVFQKAREGVIDAASPVLEIFSGPIAYVGDAVGHVTDYFNVLKQNEALRQENTELRQWMEEALELREVLAAYEGLQNYQAPPEAQPIDAYVIGETNDAFARSMLVNAGRARNVEVGQAVVDEKGLIGRIVDTGGSASRVLLLTDIQSRIPIYVEGADLDGLLVGNTRSMPTISFTSSSEPAEVIPGQRVLTSGAGGVLPRGLPVGIIDDQQRGDIAVDLYANYVRTRMVRIINYEFPSFDAEEDISAEDSPEGETDASANDDTGVTPAEG